MWKHKPYKSFPLQLDFGCGVFIIAIVTKQDSLLNPLEREPVGEGGEKRE